MATPYSISDGAVCSAILEGRLYGQQVMMTTYYQYDGPIITDGYVALSTFATALNAVGGVAARYSLVTPVELTTLRWRLQWIRPDRYFGRTIAAVPASGSRDNTSIVNIQAALTFQSNLADRRGHATKHIVIPQGDVSGGVLTAGIITALDQLGAAMLLPLVVGAGVMDPVMYGRPRPADLTRVPPRPALPESIRTIAAYTVGDTQRVQRRRTVGLGA